MAEVFAGFVAGYALALISTPLIAFGLVRLRGSSPLLARVLPEGVTAVPLAVLIHMALFFFWTALGMLLGLLLLGMRDSDGALGSLNAPYTLFVAGLTLALVAPIAAILRPLRSATLVGGVLVVLIFGWLMPYLAEWSAFDAVPKERQGPQVSWFL
ncbi:MAG TPA: hypothetical protein VJB57_20335 [Dehalococcoidia bacterium]|nr:hypothetical protein [Dehalococcoidia bacterium]